MARRGPLCGRRSRSAGRRPRRNRPTAAPVRDTDPIDDDDDDDDDNNKKTKQSHQLNPVPLAIHFTRVRQRSFHKIKEK